MNNVRGNLEILEYLVDWLFDSSSALLSFMISNFITAFSLGLLILSYAILIFNRVKNKLFK